MTINVDDRFHVRVRFTCLAITYDFGEILTVELVDDVNGIVRVRTGGIGTYGVLRASIVANCQYVGTVYRSPSVQAGPPAQSPNYQTGAGAFNTVTLPPVSTVNPNGSVTIGTGPAQDPNFWGINRAGAVPYLTSEQSPTDLSPTGEWRGFNVCECGQKGVTYAIHSDYCPLYEKPSKI